LRVALGDEQTEPERAKHEQDVVNPAHASQSSLANLSPSTPSGSVEGQ
jgi:hypothetical protein